MHILIVDDHAFVCAGLKATLLDTLDDIQVTTTERGEEVLSILGKEDIDWLGLLIKNLRRECSVILVEHHMDVVMAVCERLYVLDFGEVIASGSAEKVRQDPAVIAAYLGTAASEL